MQVSALFIWFILYSIIGWVYETVYCSIKSLKWDNRGILMGPYCPIYGVGAVLDVLLCGGLGSGWAVFFACMAGSAVLEYATSYGMERMAGGITAICRSTCMGVSAFPVPLALAWRDWLSYMASSRLW